LQKQLIYAFDYRHRRPIPFKRSPVSSRARPVPTSSAPSDSSTSSSEQKKPRLPVSKQIQLMPSARRAVQAEPQKYVIRGFHLLLCSVTLRVCGLNRKSEEELPTSSRPKTAPVKKVVQQEPPVKNTSNVADVEKAEKPLTSAPSSVQNSPDEKYCHPFLLFSL
jgi:hypothetical protein